MSNRSSFGPWLGGVVVLALGLGLAFWGISTRATSLGVVTRETRELSVPTVSVITPERGAPQQEIVLPGTMQAFTDAAIYARVPGYLRKWYVDLGARVRTGQLRAAIDTPEIDQQPDQVTPYPRPPLPTPLAGLPPPPFPVSSPSLPPLPFHVPVFPGPRPGRCSVGP